MPVLFLFLPLSDRTGARFDAGEGLDAGGPIVANPPTNSRGEQQARWQAID